MVSVGFRKGRDKEWEVGERDDELEYNRKGDGDIRGSTAAPAIQFLMGLIGRLVSVEFPSQQNDK